MPAETPMETGDRRPRSYLQVTVSFLIHLNDDKLQVHT